ncbi:GTPase Era [[Eubacterium] hominis]|uniref:GTPase Era n=1 Tax=[Eubacterium] hominis TaxID=2764325 RepID=UPI003A4DEB17
MMYKSGFISIIGRPNAGKSTLLNAILKEKIAITSDKPQTTRNNISGILTREDAQFVFIDTPGIHKPKHELGKTLNKNAYTAIAEADINFWMVDATQSFGSGDEFILEKMKTSHIPCFLILNKIDLLDKEKLIKVLKSWQDRFAFAEIFPISALKKENIDHLLEVTKEYLEEGPKYFPDDMISDHGEQFQIAEIIREKVLYKTKEEVPHSVAVVIEKKEETDTKVFLQAMIVVERTSQKSILIGKQGAMIRGIRLAAQKELKEKFHKKVELELFVRVEKNWRNRSSKLQQLGYLEMETNNE